MNYIQTHSIQRDNDGFLKYSQSYCNLALLRECHTKSGMISYDENTQKSIRYIETKKGKNTDYKTKISGNILHE